MSDLLVATSIRESVEELNSMILQGQILEAFDKFYADDVVMADNFTGDRAGFDACRKFEEDFVANLTAFRGAEVQDITVDEDNGLAFVKWHFDYTHKEWGDKNYVQVAVQRWKDGKIVHERFLYGF
ncbi:MAG: nuclear transport factor 2 family protein [Rhodothermales bacterium]|nr:nuclear transport factor 2 family protein [Rhodothermales bacterium]MBO6780030.1 nuclear transport factor 2 family protein [Rhodothermales bacterium]